MPSYRNLAFVAALSVGLPPFLVRGQPCPPATTVPMTFNGDAACVDGRIRLTDEVGEQTGSAYTSASFSDSTNFPFEAYVEYEIVDTGVGGRADGTAFVLHNDPNGLTALSAVGGGLGVYNGGPTSGPGGIANALIIEFDTYFNDEKGTQAPFSSINYDTAIDVITTGPDGVATRIFEQDVSDFTAAWKLLWGAHEGALRVKFWISYSKRVPGVLDIYFGGEYTDPRPDHPFISVEIDLGSILAGEGEPPNVVYCGVSASTGGEFDQHEVVAFTGCAEAHPPTASPTPTPTASPDEPTNDAPTPAPVECPVPAPPICNDLFYQCGCCPLEDIRYYYFKLDTPNSPEYELPGNLNTDAVCQDLRDAYNALTTTCGYTFVTDSQPALGSDISWTVTPPSTEPYTTVTVTVAGNAWIVNDSHGQKGGSNACTAGTDNICSNSIDFTWQDPTSISNVQMLIGRCETET